MGRRAGVVRVGRGIRAVHRAADLRGRSRRLSTVGRQVRLHVPPVFLRPPEYKTPVHLSPVCSIAVRSVAAGVRQRRLGAGRLDDGQSRRTDRCARPLRSPGEAVTRQSGDLASRPGVEPPRRTPQSGSDHDRLRAGESVRDLSGHVGPPQRPPHRKTPDASRGGNRAGRSGEAHPVVVRALPGHDATLARAP